MKIVRNARPSIESVAPSPSRAQPWKILVVDDEADIRRLTALNLRGFTFAGRGLELLEADCAKAARELLSRNTDIALALIDVVMETDDAGLRLVEHIRGELNNRLIRLVIRTGQPGAAPERYVIENFDIDDYKDKTELTSQKLYTTVRTALKGYRDLQTIEMNRIGLARILDITPELYNLELNKLEEYFRGVLTQIIALCNLGGSSLISSIDGLVATVEGNAVKIHAGTGEFSEGKSDPLRRDQIMQLCSTTIHEVESPPGLREGAVVAPLKVADDVLGFIYLEPNGPLSLQDIELIQVMANQCAAALNNLRLHHSLAESYDEAIDMLANVAEYKDSATGEHIYRLQQYTLRIAQAMGFSEQDADALAKASRLHDMGKVGIPDRILRKEGQLTPEEYRIIQSHTRIGDTVLSRSQSLELARVVARMHHERWDGRGYPSGLCGEDIPLAARIVAVVDVFDALVSRRPYKEPWTSERAAKEIEANSGTQFDPRVVEIFLSIFRQGRFDDLIAESTQVTGGA